MFAIGVLSQSVTVGPYFVHENLSLVGLGHINHFLNDIVGKLIFHHYVQCTGSPVAVGAHLLNQMNSVRAVGMLDTLFHNIGSKFMLGQSKNFAANRTDYKGFVLLLSTFEDMLNDVVSILILEQLFCIGM
jgi:hypothetical protein